MLLARNTFEYQGRILIEKVVIKTPFRYEALFEEEGCFLYISGRKSHFHTSNQSLAINSKEAVLLKCGHYFVDWLKRNVDEERVEIIAIHLYPEMLKRLYAHELPSVIKKRVLEKRISTIIPDDTLEKFIENLNFYFENPALVNDDLLELKIKELILLLIQSKNAESVVQLLEELFSPLSASLRDVVHTNLYTNLTAEELARLTNMSLSSFKRAFKSTFNDTPANYFLNKRLERAAEQLMVTKKGINDIAYETGFSDPDYFSRVFKRKYGLAPTTYRGK
ncbi:helix-turn-helix domain-containing protein [Ekhidna sp.]|uniref:helix-turn-helix domain-containing protein n=1 Tax=Ekhidna sp. TaxID=2608089 RepID=UPI003C7D9723